MGIFSGNNKDELTLVFDIGSSSIGGALFYAQKSRIPKIIYSIREPIATEEKVDFDRFFTLTQKTLEDVAKIISEKRLGVPARIFCVLSSAWYVSQTRVIKMERNTPFVFTNKLADGLIQKEVAIFEEEYVKNNGGNVRPIELKNIKTVLNGYETPNPIDQKATDLQMTLFVSVSSEDVLKKFEEVIEKYYPHKPIQFNSFVMSSFITVRDMYQHQDDFLLIDIGGEVTDITMIKKNTLRESISFPMGRNFIIRNVAQALSSSLDEARAFISMLKDGHANEEVIQKIAPAMKKIKGEWLQNFQSSLANLSNDMSIPATIFIAIDEQFGDFFAEIIRNEQFNQYTLTSSKFQILFLNTQSLHGAAMFSDETVRDPFLIIESIYINRFLNKI